MHRSMRYLALATAILIGSGVSAHLHAEQHARCNAETRHSHPGGPPPHQGAESECAVCIMLHMPGLAQTAPQPMVFAHAAEAVLHCENAAACSLLSLGPAVCRGPPLV